MNRDRWITAGIVLALLFSLLGLAIDLNQGPAPEYEAAAALRPVTYDWMSATLITSTAQGSDSVNVGYYREALGYIYTTVNTGTITYTIQSSPDGGDTWFDHTDLTAVSATGGVSVPLSTFGPTLRITCAVGGTTNVTTTAWLSLKE